SSAPAAMIVNSRKSPSNHWRDRCHSPTGTPCSTTLVSRSANLCPGSFERQGEPDLLATRRLHDLPVRSDLIEEKDPPSCHVVLAGHSQLNGAAAGVGDREVEVVIGSLHLDFYRCTGVDDRVGHQLGHQEFGV